MPRIQVWKDEDEAKVELQKRLSHSKDEKRTRQYRWEENERTVFNPRGGQSVSANVSYSFESDVSAVDGVDQSNSDIGTNYTLKNARLIQAQLSANPPSVVPRPTSNDPEDRRRADAADRLIRYALKHYKITEYVDEANWNMLIYGTGFIKTMWDKDGGDPLSLDKETGEMVMEGDFHVSVPDPWNIFIDSEAVNWNDVRYIFERVYLSYEEACFLYPDKKDILKKVRIQDGSEHSGFDRGGNSAISKSRYDSVELYQYWEKGLPQNGFLGRFCVCTRDGDLLTEVEENPEQYRGNDQEIPRAVLPFHIFTDLDVPGQVWGQATVEYQSQLQDNLNRLDSVILESVQAHGVPRIILPEGAEIEDDSITNSPWDVIKITGSMPPHYMEPMPMPAGVSQLREMLKMGIDDMAGVNDAMFGKQSREQSGFSMQYAANQGNMSRRRTFNKYVLFVEMIYKRYLQIVQKNWQAPRTISVLGKEKAFETIDIAGADIASGYDLVVEYGASLSLDPTTRREEIITLMPLFEKAGVESRELLRMLKLNELSGMYDILDLARDRQREVFEEMIARGVYIAPEPLEDHTNMLSYAKYYRMTTEFKYLDEDNKILIERHIVEREMMAAQAVAGQVPGPLGGMAPGPAPQGPDGQLPPVPGPEQQMEAAQPTDTAAVIPPGQGPTGI